MIASLRTTRPPRAHTPARIDVHGLAHALTRLEAHADAAIAAMTEGDPIDDVGAARTKAKLWAELSRYDPTALTPGPGGADLVPLVTRVRAKLEHELKLLSHRKAASDLVTDLLADALAREEGDGTYAPPRPARAPATLGGRP